MAVRVANASSTVAGASLLVAVSLGFVLVALWLIAWYLLLNAAQWFASATALVGVVLLLLSGVLRPTVLRTAFKVAGGLAMALAVVAALSIGAFLPAVVAEWASPVLGKFGGWPTLLIVAVGLLLGMLTGAITRRRAFALDVAMFCVLAALWVWTQVPRQAEFPPPPTTPTMTENRFFLVYVLVGIMWSLDTIIYILGLRTLVIRIPEANTTIARGPSSPVGTLVAPWLWRWSFLLAALGLLVTSPAWVWLLQTAGLPANPSTDSWQWYLYGVTVLAILGSRLFIILRDERRLSILLGRLARGLGWLILWSLAVGLIYFAVAEDLEAVMLRNTVERYVMQFWRGVAGDERFVSRPAGVLSGTVMSAENQPLEGASVVVATVSGQAFSATSVTNGAYRVEGVPVGSYLPMAAAPGYVQSPASERVVTVRAGATTGGVNFHLARTRPINIASGAEGLNIGQPTTSSVEHPEPSVASRREFTYTNEGMTLKGGLVHEPSDEMGQGPFPILLIVYPGEANRWEGVSIPLAAKGYVVVSYFPVRLIDLEGDVDDLRVLLGHVAAGRLSERGDSNRIVLVGGSVSTVYTYLMAREMEGSPVREQTAATIQYGGLFDFFHYRETWEQGKITIDPGISELEYLLVAFGRPDTRPELYLRLSPRYALGPNSLPPTLLVHAGSDIIVPSDQSDLAKQVFQRLNFPHDYLFYPNIEHYLDVTTRDPTQIDMLNKTLAFLDIYVR